MSECEASAIPSGFMHGLHGQYLIMMFMLPSELWPYLLALYIVSMLNI